MPSDRLLDTIDGAAEVEGRNGFYVKPALLEGDLVPFDSGDGRMTPTPRKLVALVEYLRSVQVSPDP